MKKFISIILCVILCLSLSACGPKFADEKAALTGTKWFSGKDTVNSIVVWDFFEESVERVEYFVDGNGMHESNKAVAEYEIQKDAIKVSFDDEEMMVPYVFEDGKMILEKGIYFSPADIDEAIQGFWTLRKTDYVIGMRTDNEYNVQFENGVMRIEEAADAMYGEPGEYYYYGPYECTYEIGNGTFETDADHGDRYFFIVHDGMVNVYEYGNQMSRGDGFPGQNGYVFD